MTITTLTLNAPALHAGQRKIANHPARFRVLACGRRWGKTRLGSALCVQTATTGGRAWWVAPTYPVATVGWRLVRRLAIQIPGAEIRQGDRMVILPNGGEVQVRSADNPDSLRGEGLDFVVMDECAFMKEEAFTEALRPALSDRKGRAMFISTPKGRNWFWRAWQRCTDEHDADWHGWQLPTVDNPYIDPNEIDAARRMLPETVFRQEYLAEFLDDAGGVFRNVMACATAAPQASEQRNHEYIFGIDWARSNDYTVVAVIDATLNALVYLDRYNNLDYTIQRERVGALAARFRPTAIIAEANAMGRPNNEMLRAAGLPVQDFTTGAASKERIISHLAASFEHGGITVIPDTVLISELQAYEGTPRGDGGTRYSAPSGMHDDTVMALALAWHGAANDAPLTFDVVNYAQYNI